MNETNWTEITQNLTNSTNVTLPPVPSPDVIHDNIFGSIWGILVGAVQWALNAIGIPVSAEHAGWIVLGIMVISLYRNLNRVKNMGEDLFKVALGIGVVLFVMVVVLDVKII